MGFDCVFRNEEGLANFPVGSSLHQKPDYLYFARRYPIGEIRFFIHLERFAGDFNGLEILTVDKEIQIHHEH